MLPVNQIPKGNGRDPNNFRILFLYPNIQMSALMPSGIALLSAVLKREGFTVDLFDCTFYKNPMTANYPFYHSALRPVKDEEEGAKVRTLETDMKSDFKKKVEDFKPDLIAVSVVENTYTIGLRMIQALPKRPKIIFGGVFATHGTEKILREEAVDYVCRGEGEEAMLELCWRLCRGLPATDVQNLWLKEGGEIYRNTMRPALDLNTLPYPDFDLFEPQSIYRPMQGKIWRTIGMETQRGCPYTCAYCNSPSNNEIYTAEKSGRFYRKKTMERAHAELKFLIERYQPELIYFVVDTFLAMGEKEFMELANMYMDFKVPFWMNTRCETINENRAEWLEKMNCLRMSMGIEHGNPVYREKVLKRKLTNEKMLEAFRLVAGRKYAANGNSIVGMPQENRELIFDTIEFNRQLPKEIESTGAFIFAPYHGTPLREMAVKEGYLDPETICSLDDPDASMLNMPQLPREETVGLARTFNFYTTFPKEEWSRIQQAERTTPEAEEIFQSLQSRYVMEQYGPAEPDAINA